MPKTSALRDEAIERVQRIPPRKLGVVLDFLSYLEDRESWEATQELLTDPDMRRDVEEGVTQAKRKQGRSWKTIQRDVRG